MWALAVYDLRVPYGEVGALNMRTFDALLRRKRTADNRAQYNAGLVAAMVHNMLRDPKSDAVRPSDFVPDWKEKDEVSLSGMTPEEQKAALTALFSKRR